MDGVHPLWRGVWNGGGVCCAGLPDPVCVARAPVRPSAVLVSTATRVVRRSLPGVWCEGECLSVLLCVVGFPCLRPPRRWCRGGPSWMAGWRDEGG